MDEGHWVVIAISAVIVGLEECYRRYQFRKRLREILREHLSEPRWTWRSFEGLKRAIREENDETVRQLLFEVPARPSEKEKNVWTLVSK